MKTYKAGELREDMLVVPVHALEAERQELARLRADSAELARVRETMEIDMPYTLVNVPDSNETRVIGFRISKSDEAYGEMGLSEPLAWFRKWVGQIASSKGRRIPEGFALVPVEPTEEQWGGLARAIVFWMRSYPSNKQTPATLVDFLRNYVDEMPAWMGDESELSTQDHVISKGTIAVLIYKAMLAAAPKGDSHE